jgi:hypothetical protein
MAVPTMPSLRRFLLIECLYRGNHIGSLIAVTAARGMVRITAMYRLTVAGGRVSASFSRAASMTSVLMIGSRPIGFVISTRRKAARQPTRWPQMHENQKCLTWRALTAHASTGPDWVADSDGGNDQPMFRWEGKNTPFNHGTARGGVPADRRSR